MSSNYPVPPLIPSHDPERSGGKARIYDRVGDALGYLRYRLFRSLLGPFGAWARRRRMLAFFRVTRMRAGASVLDLGGSARFWSYSFIPRLRITVLNLPGASGTSPDDQTTRHSFTYIEGDACNVAGMADGTFDFAFSNSVIEHVGGPEKRVQFAAEVKRLGRAYWVQTPSIWFPIEAHTGMPFWWFYPASLRQYFIERWRKKLPEWAEAIEGTTVVRRRELEALFPGSRVLVERVLGIPKSYTVFKIDPRGV